MSKFWELLEESVLIQGLVTLGVVYTTMYMMATGQEMPDLLTAIVTLVLGFYFGQKSQQALTTTIKRMIIASDASAQEMNATR